MRRVGPPLLPALALCLAVAAAPAPAADERAAPTPRIYKWVDANGIAHYTTDPERVPKALRNRIETLSRPAAETPAANAGAAAVAPEPPLAATPEPPAPLPMEGAAGPAPALSETPGPLPALSETPGPLPALSETPGPAPAAIGASVVVPAPAPAAAPAGEAWATRDAAPRLRSRAELLASGHASPEELAALDAERQALDTRIAEVEAEIARDETVLKDLISDPELDAEVPLFDRPEFLEISRRLPELQARLQELRDERAKLETP